MDEFIDSSHTLYAIYVKVPCEYNIEIGRLVVINLDTTLSTIYARTKNITKIITYENSIGECQLAEKLRKEEGGIYPVTRFGASDCRCTSHLIYAGN